MRYLIWLQLVLGAGNNKVKDILEKFGNAKNIYKSNIKELETSGLFTKRILKKISETKIFEADKIILKCKTSGIRVLTIEDNNYPENLINIPNPPLVLFYKGDLPDFSNEACICIVGPRDVSEYGKKAAFSLSARLSRAGMIIISGGAVGCDTYAHKGALKYSNKTVLVMGCGHNYRYLPENEKMRRLIIQKGGCIISEYPPDTPPYGSNFPVRNRLMSSLSLGTVVIEADSRSGALITANHALEQGQDVFVIPGSPGKPEYIGSNALLRDGAIPLLEATDILNEYASSFPDKINIERAYSQENNDNSIEKNTKKKKIFDIPLSKEAKMIYNQLDKPQFYPDDLDKCNLDNDEILSALIELEISGVIRALPGGKYALVND